MSILKSLAAGSEFISNPIEQGSAETDWASYTASVESKGKVLQIFPWSSKDVIVTPQVVSEGEALCYQMTTESTVTEITPDSVTYIGEPYEINGLKYNDYTIVTSGNTTNALSICFSPDGLLMFLLSMTNDDVDKYVLTIPWDVSTATYSAQTAALTTQDATPLAFCFSYDGTKLYSYGNTNGRIYQYNMNTPWSGVATYASKYITVTGTVTAPTDFCFSYDGTKLYIIGSADVVYQFTLSTAWDITTATYASLSFSVTATQPAARAIHMDTSGTRLYVLDPNAGIFQYNLSTAWNISTAAYSGYMLAVSSATLGIFIDDNKKYLFALRSTSAVRYIIFTPWMISTAVLHVNNMPNSAYTSSSSFAFSTDGTKLFISASGASRLYQYTLTIPWDIDSGAYSGVSLSTSYLCYAALLFDKSGTRVCTASGMTILCATLPSAFNISSSTDLSSKVFTFTSGNIASLAFNADGTKIFMLVSPYVYELNVPTPWVASSASASVTVRSCSFNTYGTITSMCFSSDGMYIFIATSTGLMYRFSLAGPWDISVAPSLIDSAVSAGGTVPTILVHPEGSFFYFLYSNGVNQIRLFSSLVNVDTSGLGATPARIQKSDGLLLSTAAEDSATRCISKDTELDIYSATTSSITARLNSTELFFSSVGTDLLEQGDTVLCNVNNAETSVNVLSSSYSAYKSSLVTDMVYSGLSKYLRGSIYDLAFSSDGTKLTVIFNGVFYTYTLSTPWLLSSAVDSSNIASPQSTSYGFTFSANGMFLYLFHYSNSTVYRYPLGTAWTPSTYVNSPISIGIATYSVNPTSITFSSSGTNMYVSSGSYITQYGLSTAWDISTALYVARISSGTPVSYSIRISENGKYLFAVYGENILQYSMSTPFLLSTASLLTVKSLSAQNSVLTGCYIKPDGLSIYVSSNGTGYCYQYDLSSSVLEGYEEYKQFILDIETQQYVPTTAKIPSRAAVDTEVSKEWFSGDTIKTTFQKQYKPNARAIQYKLSAAEDTEISKVKYDLERE